MYHVAKMNKSARQQNIECLDTVDGELLYEQEDISNRFLDVFKEKFRRPAGGNGSSEMLEGLDVTLTDCQI